MKIARRMKRRIKRTYQLIFKPSTRQIAAAIRLGETKERNRAKLAAQAKADVWIDRLAMREQGYKMSAWNSPERNTDKPRVIHQPRGAYFQQRRHDPEFQETRHELPKMPRNPMSIARLEPMNDWLL